MQWHITIEVYLLFKIIHLGFAFSDLGSKEDAIKDFTKTIEINPQYAEAYLGRG